MTTLNIKFVLVINIPIFSNVWVFLKLHVLRLVNHVFKLKDVEGFFLIIKYQQN